MTRSGLLWTLSGSERAKPDYAEQSALAAQVSGYLRERGETKLQNDRCSPVLHNAQEKAHLSDTELFDQTPGRAKVCHARVARFALNAAMAGEV